MVRFYDLEGVPLSNEIIITDQTDQGHRPSVHPIDSDKYLLLFQTNNPLELPRLEDRVGYVVGRVIDANTFEMDDTFVIESDVNLLVTAPEIIIGENGDISVFFEEPILDGDNLDGSFTSFIGSDSDDVLDGFDGDDEIAGGAGNDILSGNRGNDTLKGGSGNDNIKGGGGDDRLRGNGGDDTLKGGGGDDNIKGGGGDDNIKGNGGSDVIKAGGGADTVKGGGGADVINGGGGADLLQGGGGNDTITGKGGDDTLKGNGGADVFQFRASDRNDTILDFRQGQDLIEIQTGANSFAALDIEQDGRDVLIGFGAGQVRVVTDSVGAFDEDDFIF